MTSSGWHEPISEKKKCLLSLNSKTWVGMGVGGSKGSTAEGKEHNCWGQNWLLNRGSTPSRSYHFLTCKTRGLILTFKAWCEN